MPERVVPGSLGTGAFKGAKSGGSRGGGRIVGSASMAGPIINVSVRGSGTDKTFDSISAHYKEFSREAARQGAKAKRRSERILDDFYRKNRDSLSKSQLRQLDIARGIRAPRQSYGMGVQMATQAGRLGSGVLGLPSRVTQTAQAVGAAGALAAPSALPLVGGLAASTIVLGQGMREFTSFQAETAKAVALVGDGSTEVTRVLEKQVRDIAKKWAEPITETAWSTYQALSGAVTFEESQRFGETSSRLAKGEFLPDVSHGVDLLTTILNSYSMEAREAAVVTDKLSETIKYGKVTAEQMANSMATLTPIAAAMSIPFDEVLGMIASMTAQGVNANEATTYIRRALVELGNEAGKAGKHFRRLAGEDFKQFIEGGGTVVEAMKIMTDGAKEQGTSVANYFGRIQATQATQILTSEAGISRYKEANAALERSFGVTAQKAFTMQQTTSDSLTRIGAAARDSLISIGQFVSKGLEGVIDRDIDAAYATDLFTEALYAEWLQVDENIKLLEDYEALKERLAAQPGYVGETPPERVVEQAAQQLLETAGIGPQLARADISPQAVIDAALGQEWGVPGKFGVFADMFDWGNWAHHNQIKSNIRSFLAEQIPTQPYIRTGPRSADIDRRVETMYTLGDIDIDTLTEDIFNQLVKGFAGSIENYVAEFDASIALKGISYDEYNKIITDFTDGVITADEAIAKIEGTVREHVDWATIEAGMGTDNLKYFNKAIHSTSKYASLAGPELVKVARDLKTLQKNAEKGFNIGTGGQDPFKVFNEVINVQHFKDGFGFKTTQQVQVPDYLNQPGMEDRRERYLEVLAEQYRQLGISNAEIVDHNQLLISALDANTNALFSVGFLPSSALSGTTPTYNTLTQWSNSFPDNPDAGFLDQSLAWQAMASYIPPKLPEKSTKKPRLDSGELNTATAIMAQGIASNLGIAQSFMQPLQQWYQEYVQAQHDKELDADQSVIDAKIAEYTQKLIDGLIKPGDYSGVAGKMGGEWYEGIEDSTKDFLDSAGLYTKSFDELTDQQQRLVIMNEKYAESIRAASEALDQFDTTEFGLGGTYAGMLGIGGSFKTVTDEWLKNYVDTELEAGRKPDEDVISQQHTKFLNNLLSGEFSMGDYSTMPYEQQFMNKGAFDGLENATLRAIDAQGLLHKDFEELSETEQELIIAIERQAEAVRDNTDAVQEVKENFKTQQMRRSIDARLDVMDMPRQTVQIMMDYQLELAKAAEGKNAEFQAVLQGIMNKMNSGGFNWSPWLQGSAEQYKKFDAEGNVVTKAEGYGTGYGLHLETTRQIVDQLGFGNLTQEQIAGRSAFDAFTIQEALKIDRRAIREMQLDVQFEKGVVGIQEYLDAQDIGLYAREKAAIEKYGEWSYQALAIWERIEALLEEMNANLIDGLKINIGDATRDFERLIQTKDGNYEVTPEYIEQLQRSFNG